MWPCALHIEQIGFRFVIATMVAHLMTLALLYVSLGKKVFFVIIDALQASPQVYITHHLTGKPHTLFGGDVHSEHTL
jgi:hypothetical protein